MELPFLSEVGVGTRPTHAAVRGDDRAPPVNPPISLPITLRVTEARLMPPQGFRLSGQPHTGQLDASNFDRLRVYTLHHDYSYRRGEGNGLALRTARYRSVARCE